MSYRDVNSAQQAIRRNLNSVNLEPENRAALEAVAVCMAAAGKPGEFVTYMQALEKTETQVDLKAVSDNLNELVNVMKAKEQPKTDNRLEHFLENDIEQLKADKAMLESRLAALESK